MITPESVAITMMATLAPLIPIAVADMVPVVVTILAAVAVTYAHADTIFTHADANLRGRRQSHRQHCGTYQSESKLFHFNLL
jgi:predicted anti-sigma-YlaC factor YlaD